MVLGFCYVGFAQLIGNLATGLFLMFSHIELATLNNNTSR
jgi:hypothetical protein